MFSIFRFAQSWSRSYMSDEGATAVEYGIMVALIAAVIITIVGLIGGQLQTVFTSVWTALGGTVPDPT